MKVAPGIDGGAMTVRVSVPHERTMAASAVPKRSSPSLPRESRPVPMRRPAPG